MGNINNKEGLFKVLDKADEVNSSEAIEDDFEN